MVTRRSLLPPSQFRHFQIVAALPQPVRPGALEEAVRRAFSCRPALAGLSEDAPFSADPHQRKSDQVVPGATQATAQEVDPPCNRPSDVDLFKRGKGKKRKGEKHGNLPFP